MIVWRILLSSEVAVARKAHPKALDGLQEGYPGPIPARLSGYRVARPLAATLGAGKKALAVVRAELSAPKSWSYYNYAARKYPVALEPAAAAPVDLDADVPAGEQFYLVFEESKPIPA